MGLVGLRHKGQTWNNLGRCGLLNPLSQCCIQEEEELGEPAVQAPQIATAPKAKKMVIAQVPPKAPHSFTR